MGIFGNPPFLTTPIDINPEKNIVDPIGNP